MKTYFTDIIPHIQRFSEKLDNLTLLTNQHWVIIDETTETKTVYIFRTNNELLIVINGKVTKAKWEYLGNRSILMDNENDSYLFKHAFLDANVLALKVDTREEYAFFVNESKCDGEINSLQKVLEFLKAKYATKHDSNNNISPVIETASDKAEKSLSLGEILVFIVLFFGAIFLVIYLFLSDGK